MPEYNNYRYYVDPEEIDEEEEESLGDILAKMGKGAASGLLVGMPAGYILGGGKGLVYGGLAGSVTGAVKGAMGGDTSVRGNVLPAGGVALAAGGMTQINKIGKEKQAAQEENLKLKKIIKDAGINMSNSEKKEISDFLSAYTKEGIQNFSQKLKNFAIGIDALSGAAVGLEKAPQGEKTRYAATGSIGGVGGGAAGTVLGGLGGASIGASAGFWSGHGIKGRLGNSLIGAVSGSVGGGIFGGIAGSREGAKMAVEDLVDRDTIRYGKRRKEMWKNLPRDEKIKILKEIKRRKQKRAKEAAEEYMNAYEVGFSDSLKKKQKIGENENFAVGSNLISLAKRFLQGLTGSKTVGQFGQKSGEGLRNLAVKHPVLTLGFPAGATAIGIAKTRGAEQTGKDVRSIVDSTKKTGSDFLSGFFNSNDNKAPNVDLKSTIGGAAIGGLVGTLNDGDAISSSLFGGASGALGSYLAQKGGLSSAASLGVGLGSSALTAWLLSKAFNNKNKSKKEKDETNIEDVVPIKRGRGRPRKQLISDPFMAIE